jgi:hypothetical protein
MSPIDVVRLRKGLLRGDGGANHAVGPGFPRALESVGSWDPMYFWSLPPATRSLSAQPGANASR